MLVLMHSLALYAPILHASWVHMYAFHVRNARICSYVRILVHFVHPLMSDKLYFCIIYNIMLVYFEHNFVWWLYFALVYNAFEENFTFIFAFCT